MTRVFLTQCVEHSDGGLPRTQRGTASRRYIRKDGERQRGRKGGGKCPGRHAVGWAWRHRAAPSADGNAWTGRPRERQFQSSSSSWKISAAISVQLLQRGPRSSGLIASHEAHLSQTQFPQLPAHFATATSDSWRPGSCSAPQSMHRLASSSASLCPPLEITSSSLGGGLILIS